MGRPGRRINELWSDVPAAKVELETWLSRERHRGHAFWDGLSGVRNLSRCSLFVHRRSATYSPRASNAIVARIARVMWDKRRSRVALHLNGV